MVCGKILSIGTKTLIQKHENNFYLVTVTTVMHNMMAKERVEISEEENSDIYKVLDVNNQDEVVPGLNYNNLVGHFDACDACDATLQY